MRFYTARTKHGRLERGAAPSRARLRPRSPSDHAPAGRTDSFDARAVIRMQGERGARALRDGDPLKHFLARIWLFLFRWRPDGERPTEPRFVLIAAPHTSNWDMPHMIAFAWYYGVEVRWLGKHQIFRWPFGGLMRALGGVPVIRERRTNMVDAMAKAVVDTEVKGDRPLGLVIPAEGTRGYTDYWKSGFYHIARKAGVPIVLSYLDYSTGTGGFGPIIHPTGDIPADMDRIRAYYEGRKGRCPELFGPVRLHEEEANEVVEEEQARA